MCDTSPLPRQGRSSAQVNLPVPAAAWCSVLGNGGLTQDSSSFSLPTQGCFGAGRTGAILVRRAGSPLSPWRLQQAPHCLSCRRGSLIRKAQGTVMASALAGLGQGGGTRATVLQQHMCPHGTGTPWDQSGRLCPEALGLGTHCHAQTPPNPSVGWARPAGVGVSLQSKLLSQAVNLQSASDCVLQRGTA